MLVSLLQLILCAVLSNRPRRIRSKMLQSSSPVLHKLPRVPILPRKSYSCASQLIAPTTRSVESWRSIMTMYAHELPRAHAQNVKPAVFRPKVRSCAPLPFGHSSYLALPSRF